MPDPIYVDAVQGVGLRLGELSRGEGSGEEPRIDLGGTLSAAVDAVIGGGLDSSVGAFLDGWPSALQRALVGTLAGAVESKLPALVTWLPASDYEVTIAQPTRGSDAMLSVVLRSPYPSDIKSSA